MQVLNPDTAAARQYLDDLNAAVDELKRANLQAFNELTERVANILVGQVPTELPGEIIAALPAGYTMHGLIDAALTLILEGPKNG